MVRFGAFWAQWRRQAWGTGARAPLEFANARKFCRTVSSYDCCHQMSDFKAKMHQIRFRLGLLRTVRWQISLLDDFVITNFGTRAPRARAPLEQNSGDAIVWVQRKPKRNLWTITRWMYHHGSAFTDLLGDNVLDIELEELFLPVVVRFLSVRLTTTCRKDRPHPHQ